MRKTIAILTTSLSLLAATAWGSTPVSSSAVQHRGPSMRTRSGQRIYPAILNNGFGRLTPAWVVPGRTAPPQVEGPSAAQLSVLADRTGRVNALRKAGVSDRDIDSNGVFIDRKAIAAREAAGRRASQEISRALSGASVLRSRGNSAGAIGALRAALTVYPEHPSLLASLARTHAQMGDREATFAAFDRKEAIAPGKGIGKVELLKVLAHAHFRAGERAATLRDLRDLKAADGGAGGFLAGYWGYDTLQPLVDRVLAER